MRGQLMVQGFYENVDPTDVDLTDLHRERFAIAVLKRQNDLDFYTKVLQTSAQIGDANTRRKFVQLLEEQYVIGLKEKREGESKREDESLAELASQYVVVQTRPGGGHVGRWTKKPEE